MISYRRTSTGEWVVCGPVDHLAAGCTVSVTGRRGTRHRELIHYLGQPFACPQTGQELVYGYLQPRSCRAAQYTCEACGRYVEPGETVCPIRGVAH